MTTTTATQTNSYQVFDSMGRPTDIYYVQLLDSASLPGDGAVTHIISAIPVSHVNGTD
jgi:hypothetical protein